ncbi:MAG TPA: Uma2 family endonuclease [Candidatus Xenobia bacterium]|jgi:Uma2 family endonuclease
MTIAPQKSTTDSVFMQTDWLGYSKVLDLIGDRHIHVTYDRGRLEILSPGTKHERGKSVLSHVLEHLMEANEVDYEIGGMVTLRREDLDRGLEPDECYWIQHCVKMRAQDTLDLLEDPPPDLAIEVEVTKTVIERLPVYAALGVPEVWRLKRDGQVEILVRTPAGEYQTVPSSPSLPGLPMATIYQFMGLSKTLTKPELYRQIQAWAATHP